MKNGRFSEARGIHGARGWRRPVAWAALVALMSLTLNPLVVLAQDDGKVIKPGDVLDLTVPDGMGGEETIKRLIEIDKNIRAIVSSGYSNDPVIANYTHYGFHGAVQKPYLVQEMSQMLRLIIKA